MFRHRRHFPSIALSCVLFGMSSAQARELCTDRPGLGTPSCTVEPGKVVVEIGLGDWTHDDDTSSRTDTIEAGQFLARFGLSDRLEAQLGWTAYGHERHRDRTTGTIERQGGTGDVTLALRRNLRNPDGTGLSIAIMPRLTLPSGGAAIGAGDWSAGLLIPVGVELNDGLSLKLTPEIDAAVDADRSGRHLAYGGAVGFDVDLTQAITATIEASAMRDDDLDGHETQALGGLAFEWQPSDDTQFDLGIAIGLNHGSPDRQVYLGFVRRF